MKNNFSLKFKIFDVFILVFALVSIVCSIIVTNVAFASSLNRKMMVEIYYENHCLKEQTIQLDKVDSEIQIVLKKEEYPHLLGDMTIAIHKDKGVCIQEVSCPNHYCEKQGWINKVGYPIVCIPNGVYVIITSSSVDQDTILG